MSDHELPCPTPLELGKSHLHPLYPLGKEDDGETLEDRACKSQVSDSALFKSKLEWEAPVMESRCAQRV